MLKARTGRNWDILRLLMLDEPSTDSTVPTFSIGSRSSPDMVDRSTTQSSSHYFGLLYNTHI